MDRRHFCKIAALAAGAFALSPLASQAAGVFALRRRGRVRVLRRECFTDLQSMYLDDPERGACEAFTPGEEFDLSGDRPEGFCPRAWESIIRCAEEASHCPGNPGEQGVIITSCPDGTRPVIFRVELS